MILASEDVGLADSNALPLTVAAFDTVAKIGMPEARIALAQATIYLALAPKSNSAYLAINAALDDVRAGFTPPIPLYLRSASSARIGSNQNYIYPHDQVNAVATQQYLSEVREYYIPKSLGQEKSLAERIEALRAIIRGKRA
jgi:putative ATPase